jgi:amino acid transporter
LVLIGFFFPTIDATYIGFYRGLKVQGIDRTKFGYYSRLQPFPAIWGTFWLTLLILINGFDVFWGFTASGFLTCYINVPLVIVLFVGWKVIKRTHWWRPDEMDFVTGIPSVEETEHPDPPPETLLGKIAEKLF